MSVCCEEGRPNRFLCCLQLQVRPTKVHRVLLTSRSPERVMGLFGVLCVISAARLRGHEFSDVPLQVVGPSGTAELLSTVLGVSDTYLEV